MTMTGIYFSGTGNTRHCAEKLLGLLDQNGRAFSMEAPEAKSAIVGEDAILFAYPIQYSNLPVMVRDFIAQNAGLWKDKQVLCLATMGLFSGDGAGCGARLLKKYGARIIGGLHLKMPDSVCDVKLLKRSPEKNRAIIQAADRKIEVWAERIGQGKYPRDGLRICDRLAGALGQRVWFRGKTRDYSHDLKVSKACVGCGSCVSLCPTNNLSMDGGRAVPGDRCTMCYRCISACPAKAITLLGKTVVEQGGYEKYV